MVKKRKTQNSFVVLENELFMLMVFTVQVFFGYTQKAAFCNTCNGIFTD